MHNRLSIISFVIPNCLFVLQEFLKKEFSEENILFWQACEFFSHVPENDKKQVKHAADHVHLVAHFPRAKLPLTLPDPSRLLQLSQRAREIYNSFLSSKATTPVNIDSQAQLADDILNAPGPAMFKEQQLQVVYTPNTHMIHCHIINSYAC